MEEPQKHEDSGAAAACNGSTGSTAVEEEVQTQEEKQEQDAAGPSTSTPAATSDEVKQTEPPQEKTQAQSMKQQLKRKQKYSSIMQLMNMLYTQRDKLLRKEVSAFDDNPDNFYDMMLGMEKLDEQLQKMYRAVLKLDGDTQALAHVNAGRLGRLEFERPIEFTSLPWPQLNAKLAEVVNQRLNNALRQQTPLSAAECAFVWPDYNTLRELVQKVHEETPLNEDLEHVTAAAAKAVAEAIVEREQHSNRQALTDRLEEFQTAHKRAAPSVQDEVDKSTAAPTEAPCGSETAAGTKEAADADKEQERTGSSDEHILQLDPPQDDALEEKLKQNDEQRKKNEKVFEEFHDKLVAAAASADDPAAEDTSQPEQVGEEEDTDEQEEEAAAETEGRQAAGAEELDKENTENEPPADNVEHNADTYTYAAPTAQVDDEVIDLSSGGEEDAGSLQDERSSSSADDDGSDQDEDDPSPPPDPASHLYYEPESKRLRSDVQVDEDAVITLD